MGCVQYFKVATVLGGEKSYCPDESTSSVTSSRDNCKYANVLSASQDIDDSMMHGNPLPQEGGNDRTKKWY